MSDFEQKEKGKCAYCGKKLPKGQRKWCSQQCADEVYDIFVAPTIKDWNVLRAKILKRDKWCRVCGKVVPWIVHHIKPVKDFPELEFDEDNCIGVCFKCHKKQHTKLANMKRKGQTLLEEKP